MRGDCGQQVAMYTYDSVSSSCVRFMYSGCDGNANRFETRAMCEVACERYMIAYEQTTPHHMDTGEYTTPYQADTGYGTTHGYLQSNCKPTACILLKQFHYLL